MPPFLEVSEHVYVERELARLFETQMAFSHASGEAVARIYNLSIRDVDTSKHLTTENVWHTFYLHALLRHHCERGTTLHLPHHGMNEHRLDKALHERNMLIAGTGQKHWAHACQRCTRYIKEADG
ncbi:hypothetical protein OBBRIDRAFT_874465, partial [Obba rivulosa]